LQEQSPGIRYRKRFEVDSGVEVRFESVRVKVNMNNSFEVGVQYCVPTTGKTLDPLAKVPEDVLEKVQRHKDGFFHAASPELVVSYNAIANMAVKAPGGVAQRAENRVVSTLIADDGAVEAVHECLGVSPRLLGAVVAAAVEHAVSYPAQASHMRTLVSEANKFNGGQTSTTANTAFKAIAGHVVTNIMNNPLMQTF
jgi:hypothetical protein